jgi:GntR family transcriptional repressor for pyruvate dehydrogenase complex
LKTTRCGQHRIEIINRKADFILAGMLKTIKIKRITEEIVSQIREQIAKGELKAGDRLPSERDMARQLGVSRPTVREALQVLEHTGFVEILQGSGTYIKDISKPSLTDPLQILIQGSDQRYNEVYEFRNAIEVWAVGLAAQRIEQEELLQLENIVETMKQYNREKKPVDELDAQFHMGIALACHNGIYYHIAKTILHLYTQVARISHKELFLTEQDQAELLADHEGIFKAIKARDANRARALMQHHLNRVTLKTTLAKKGPGIK